MAFYRDTAEREVRCRAQRFMQNECATGDDLVSAMQFGRIGFLQANILAVRESLKPVRCIFPGGFCIVDTKTMHVENELDRGLRAGIVFHERRCMRIKRRTARQQSGESGKDQEFAY